jgi:adenylate cyclase class 2
LEGAVAIEIEIKAWVDDPAAVRRELEKTGRYAGPYVKDDEYWRFEGTSGLNLGSGVRIRRESDGPGGVVNFKRKEVREGMEINDEREFAVSDAAVFSELLSRLGLVPWIRKRKVGAAWDMDGVTAELSRIEGLGDFIELELLEDRDDAETVDAARKRLLETMDRLGVPRTRIEGRYYTEMLREAFGKR